MTKEATTRTRNQVQTIDTPLETTMPSEAPVELLPGGIKIRWKLVLMVLSILLGGGTIAGLSTSIGLGGNVTDEFVLFKSEQARVHQHIETSLTKQSTHAVQQDQKIENIQQVITSVQTTQQRDVARTEARRLTEKIQARTERESSYDRIYELNLRRLARGEDPCGSLDCP